MQRGRRGKDPEGSGAALGQAGLDRRRPGRPLRGHEGVQRRPLGGERQGEARAAPPGDGAEDGRRARPDEGRGDEARPVRLLHRHRVHPRGVPRDLPGAARQAAHRRSCDALGEGREGAARGVRRRTGLRAVRRVRPRGVRRRLDRPGAPRRAARRAPGRGQDPVPGDRRGARRRPAQRRHDRAAGARPRPRPRREGDRPRAARAGDGGARLRVRGAEPAHLRPRLPRPPVHLRAGSDHPALAPPRAGHRAGRGDRLRADQAASARAAQPLRRDRLPRQPRLDLQPAALQRRPPPRQLPADGRRPGRLPRLRHDQEARPRADRARAARLRRRLARRPRGLPRGAARPRLHQAPLEARRRAADGAHARGRRLVRRGPRDRNHPEAGDEDHRVEPTTRARSTTT